MLKCLKIYQWVVRTMKKHLMYIRDIQNILSFYKCVNYKHRDQITKLLDPRFSKILVLFKSKVEKNRPRLNIIEHQLLEPYV